MDRESLALEASWRALGVLQEELRRLRVEVGRLDGAAQDIAWGLVEQVRRVVESRHEERKEV